MGHFLELPQNATDFSFNVDMKLLIKLLWAVVRIRVLLKFKLERIFNMIRCKILSKVFVSFRFRRAVGGHCRFSKNLAYEVGILSQIIMPVLHRKLNVAFDLFKNRQEMCTAFSRSQSDAPLEFYVFLQKLAELVSVNRENLSLKIVRFLHLLSYSHRHT